MQGPHRKTQHPYCTTAAAAAGEPETHAAHALDAALLLVLLVRVNSVGVL
jgi:hypothetical protein